jgi:hypothetical protein
MSDNLMRLMLLLVGLILLVFAGCKDHIIETDPFIDPHKKGPDNMQTDNISKKQSVIQDSVLRFEASATKNFH